MDICRDCVLLVGEGWGNPRSDLVAHGRWQQQAVVDLDWTAVHQGRAIGGSNRAGEVFKFKIERDVLIATGVRCRSTFWRGICVSESHKQQVNIYADVI